MDMSYLTHLKCADCGKNYRKDEIINLCTDCGKPLLARYDLKAATVKFPKSILKNRVQNIWRYREVLPVLDEKFRLTLGEGMTPLISAGRLSAKLGFDDIYIKEESLNPTTSFKARGLCVAVSRAHELGIKSFSIPSAGNAAGAPAPWNAVAAEATPHGTTTH